MKSAIEDLWRGELCPGEEPLQNTKEIQDLIISIKQHEEELKKGFSLASKLLSEAFSE